MKNVLPDNQKRGAERLEAVLLEGLKSGEPIEVTPEYWETKRMQLVARHNTKTAGKSSFD